MEADSKENILSNANSMIKEGKRAEAEKLLKDFVSEMPIGCKKDIKWSILCVDDDQVIADHLCSYLTDQKYKAFPVYSAEEALEVLSKHHIDLVITDVVMPGMNGLELTEIIKKNYDSDVIVMSGYKDGGFHEKAINIGASDFFDKPFKLDDLLVSVNRILDKQKFNHKNLIATST